MELIPLLAAAAETAASTDNAFVKVTKQFGWHPQLFWSQLFLFVVVAAALYKFAYGPILKMLEYRQAQISEALVNAEKTRAELANAQTKAQEIIAAANAQATKMIDEGRAAAARVQEAETQKAIASAEQIIAKAQEAAARDRERMLVDLKREVGRLVVNSTMRVTGKVLNPDDQKRLVEETNRELAA